MAGTRNRETIRLSFETRDRALAILRTLVRTRYFGGQIPSELELSRLLRLPKSSITLAMERLESDHYVAAAPRREFFSYGSRVQEAKSGSIAFVVNSDPLRGWYNLFADFLVGFESVMADENYAVSLATGFESPRQKIEAIGKLRAHGAMGVAFASYLERSVLRHVVEQQIPSVILGNATLYQEEIGCICSDNRTGMQKIIRHFLDQNHRSIAFYSCGLARHDGFRERYETYQHEMRTAGLEPVSTLAFSEQHNETMAAQAAEKLLALDDIPSAIACSCDREAFELVAALQHHGVRVPQQISVSGFDNNHYGHVIEPALTTVDIYSADMGRIAANYLLNEMQGPQLPVKLMVPTKLIQRNSVATLAPGSNVPGTSGEPQPSEEASIYSF
jgi:DNA-binding LacI/PurR family transcriptional regulator